MDGSVDGAGLAGYGLPAGSNRVSEGLRGPACEGRRCKSSAPADRAGALLGKPTKFPDTRPGEERASSPSSAEAPAYDQDKADLDRWRLKWLARKLLMKVEDRDKRVKVPYSEIAWLPDPSPVPSRSLFVRERYKVETDYERAPSGAWRPVQRRAPRFRVVNCCRDRIAKDILPEVWYSAASGRASFHKVKLCSSVWTCSVCSKRINLERQRLVSAAYDLFVHSAPLATDLIPQSGEHGITREPVRWGDAMMATFTIKHGIGDDFGELFGKLKQADDHMQKSYAYKRLCGYVRTVRGRRTRVPSSLDYVGRITATEVTYGFNGAHPHSHQLWFFDRRLSDKEEARLRSELFQAWSAACQAVGLPAPVEFVVREGKIHWVGVDVRRALSAEEYMTKFGHERQWSPAKEMASQHIKAARKGGRTPFQLLWDYGQGDEQAGGLFVAYAEATLGRHQLEFSKGLRRRLVEAGLREVVEATDEELAAKLAEDSRFLGQLEADEHEALTTLEHVVSLDEYEKKEPFGWFLKLCKLEGFDSAVVWVRALPSYRGPFKPAPSFPPIPGDTS